MPFQLVDPLQFAQLFYNGVDEIVIILFGVITAWNLTSGAITEIICLKFQYLQSKPVFQKVFRKVDE